MAASWWIADKQVTEISCHGLGAACWRRHRTVIDIGGQDQKSYPAGRRGNLSDFLMNDKCAAGTRFLEVISRTLGASVEQLDAITDGVEPRHYQYVHGVCRIGGH